MSAARHSGQPADQPAAIPLLRRQSEAIVTDAREALALGKTDPTRAIHAFRVAMKRWRALLRLLQQVAGDRARQLRHECAAMARELGQSRDIQAALDALADCRTAAAASQMPVRSWTTIAGRLEALRDDTQSAVLDDAAIRRLDRAFTIAARTVADWPLETVPIEIIADAIGKAFEQARRAMPADFSSAATEDLHEFRKRVIVFRYQIEMLRPLWPKVWRAYCGEVQKLRTLLGQINDLATLEAQLAPRQALSPWRSRLQPLIHAQQTSHRRAAMRLAQRIFASDAESFARSIVAQERALRAGDIEPSDIGAHA